MVKTVLYMAQTVNGYIAKEDGSTPWSNAIWESYFKTAKQFGAITLGRKTYDLMREANEFVNIGNPFVVVVTSGASVSKRNLVFVKSPKEALDVIEGNGFNEVMIGGGGRLNASFIKERLIDEIILDVEPLAFGKGIPLFVGGTLILN